MADLFFDGTIMGDQFILLNEKEDRLWGLSSEIESIAGGRKYHFDPLVLFSDGLYLGGFIEKKLITFTIKDMEYYAKDGMTWEEWVNSSYNVDGFTVISTGVYKHNVGYIMNNYQIVSPFDIILPQQYGIMVSGGSD